MDPAILILISLAQLHQIPLEYKQLQHKFSPMGALFTDDTLLLAAKRSGFRARKQQLSIKKLSNNLLPAIAKNKEGGYFLIATVKEPDTVAGVRQFLILKPNEKTPTILEEAQLNDYWQQTVFLITPKIATLMTRGGGFGIGWFLPSLKRYKRLFTEVVIASFFIQLFALATPIFFQVVMDKVLVHRGYSTLDVLAFGFTTVALFEVIFTGFRHYVFSHTTNRVDVELGAKLFDHLISLPMAWFTSRQVGQSVARVRELDSLRNFITSTALTLVIDLFFTFLFFAVLWYYSPTLTCVVLASLPAYIILSVIVTPILRRRLNEQFKYYAQNQSFLVESITGVETIKSSALEPQMQRHWENQLAQSVNASFKAKNLGNIANQVASFINKLVTIGIIWFGAHLVIDNQLTVGQLIAFNMLAGRVSGPILKIVNLWQEFQQAGISLQRLGDILNTPREPGAQSQSQVNPNAMTEIKGHLIFDNVSFSYRLEGRAIIQELNLTVIPGEVIGIVGRSGSGKSTLAKLIQRMYLPNQGRIILDGLDLSMVDSAWLRRNIGVVLQENFLFHRTIRENIAITNIALPMEKVIEAATLAGAHDFIVAQPEGYNTLIGEQGAGLSGGQRQRIAIARALINTPKILIFDEATSALDYESERCIQDNMAQICEGRTVFIVAHRLSTVMGCDRILVMDEGRIVEQGSHEQLLAMNGYYTKLHGYQSSTPKIKTANQMIQKIEGIASNL